MLKTQIKTALDAVSDISFIIDPGYTVIWENCRARNLFPNAEGISCYEAFAGRASPCEPCICMETLKNGRVNSSILPYLESEQTQNIIHCCTTSIPMTASDQVLTILRNPFQTLLNNPHDHLMHDSERICSMGFLHDVNNLLSGITGYIDLLMMSTAENEQAFQYLVTMKKSASLIESDLKMISRIYSGNPEVSKIDLFKMISHIIKFSSLNAAHINRMNRLTKDEFFVQAIPMELCAAFLNIYQNAVEAVTDLENPSISISAEVQNGIIHLIFEDNGTGMNDEIMKQATVPFFSTKNSIGYGLTMSESIIQKLHGHLSFSRSDSGNSLVTVSLPGIVHHGIEPQYRILVIDDEEKIMFLTKKMLEKSGHTVTAFSNPVDALRYYADNHSGIDLIMLDMVMPQMQGTDVFKKILSINPSARTVFISGYDIDLRSSEYKKACGFISKPFTMQNLKDTISQALNHIKSNA